MSPIPLSDPKANILSSILSRPWKLRPMVISPFFSNVFLKILYVYQFFMITPKDTLPPVRNTDSSSNN